MKYLIELRRRDNGLLSSVLLSTASETEFWTKFCDFKKEYAYQSVYFIDWSTSL